MNKNIIQFAYRYCIGKYSKEVSEMASLLRNELYKEFDKKDLLTMSFDINEHIYEILRDVCSFVITNRVEVPLNKFKPLDIAFNCFNKFEINSHTDLMHIKAINVVYKNDKFVYKVIKDSSIQDKTSMWTYIDLEKWQNVANFFEAYSQGLEEYTRMKSKCRKGLITFKEITVKCEQ